MHKLERSQFLHLLLPFSPTFLTWVCSTFFPFVFSLWVEQLYFYLSFLLMKFSLQMFRINRNKRPQFKLLTLKSNEAYNIAIACRIHKKIFLPTLFTLTSRTFWELILKVLNTSSYLFFNVIFLLNFLFHKRKRYFWFRLLFYLFVFQQ